MISRSSIRIGWLLIVLSGLMMAQGCPNPLAPQPGSGGTTTTPNLGPSPVPEPTFILRSPVPSDTVAVAIVDQTTTLAKSTIVTGKLPDRDCVDVLVSLGDIDPAQIDLVIVKVTPLSDPATVLFEFDPANPNQLASSDDFGTAFYNPATGQGAYCPPDFVNQTLSLTLAAFAVSTTSGNVQFQVGSATFVVTPPTGVLSVTLSANRTLIALPNGPDAKGSTATFTATIRGGTPLPNAASLYTVKWFGNDVDLSTLPTGTFQSTPAVFNPDPTVNASVATALVDGERLGGVGAKTIKVEITDRAGTQVSAVVSLTVNAQLDVTAAAVPNGAIITFSAIATGGFPPYTFTWDNPVNGTLQSTTGQFVNLTISDPNLPSSAQVTVTDNEGNTISKTAEPNQSLCPAPTITSNPTDIASVVEPIVFNSSAVNSTNGGTLNFRWQRRARNSQNFEDVDNDPGHISGATTPTLTIVGLLQTDDGFYKVRVTDGCAIPVSSAEANLDAVKPTVTSVLVQTGAAVDVTFSEPVLGAMTAANYTLSGSGKGTFTNQPDDISNVSGNTYRLTWNTGEMLDGGNITIAVANVTDVVGNTMGSPTSGTHTGGGIGTQPTVQSIVRLDPSPTGAATVDYRVTFSENVTGVDINDFTLTDLSNSLTGEIVTVVSAPSGTTIDVTVNTGTAGTGDLRLDVNAGTATITDNVGNPLAVSFSAGEVYAVDHSNPTVQSIVRMTPPTQFTNAASVTYLVTFSENVNGVDVADFTLTDVSAALTGESVDSVSASAGTTIEVTVITGTAGTGDLRLDVLAAAVITDDQGNDINTNFTSGEVYSIDHTNPTVQSIVRLTPPTQLTNASSVIYRVTFSENVNGVATGDFTLVDVSTALTGESVSSVSAATGTVIDVTVNTGTAGTGDLRLDVLAAATIADNQGNDLNTNFTTGDVYTVDHTDPVILNVTSNTPDSCYTFGAAIDVRVTFSEPVGVTGTPQITLNTTPVRVLNFSFSAANTIIFPYTVQTGDVAPDLDYAADSLVLNGGTITDAAGNAADLTTLPAPGAAGSLGANKNLCIDADPPAVVSIVRFSPPDQLTNSAFLTYRVTFDEPVAFVSTADFTWSDLAPNAFPAEFLFAVSSSSGTVIDVSGFMNASSGTGDMRLDVLSGVASITDTTGNLLNTDFLTGEIYTVDLDVPAVTSVVATSDDTIEITFSEPVVGSGGTGVFDPLNYTISGAGINDLDLNPQAVTLVGGNTYELEWPNSQGGAPGGAFTITVANVTDPVGNVIAAPGNSGSNTFPP